MCNLNQVFGALQRYHYSCSHQKMHHILTDPGCSGGRNKIPEESSESCCPRKASRISKISGAVRASAGGTSSTKIQDLSKAKTLSKKASTQNNNASKKFSKKNQRSYVCTICEEDSLVSGCSSNCDPGSTMMIFPTKSKEKNQKIKSGMSKSQLQDTDLKALVKAKPKRKKLVARKGPSRSTESSMEELKTPEPEDEEGVWFECNLPFRVNIPFPISIQNLLGLQAFPGNVTPQTSQCRALVPTSNRYGMPYCLTMRNGLPSPVSEPESQPSTSRGTPLCPKKKGARRGKKCLCPSPCPCETSTQTGEEDPVLCCLEEIRNQLAAISTEGEEKKQCRCFAEKSTNVRTLQSQKKVIEVAKTEESPATSVEGCSSEISIIGLLVPTVGKAQKTKRNPTETESMTSTISFQENYTQSSQSVENRCQEELQIEKECEPEKKPQKKEERELRKSLQKKEERKPILAPKPRRESKEEIKCEEIDMDSEPKVELAPKPRRKLKEEIISKEIDMDSEPKVKYSQEKLQNTTITPQIEEPITPLKPTENVKEKKSKKHNTTIKPQIEEPIKPLKPTENVKEKKSKKRKWIDPEPERFCRRPQVFLKYSRAMAQGSGCQPSWMCRWHNPAWTAPKHQPVQYPGHCYQQPLQRWHTQVPENQNDYCCRNATPANICQPFAKCSLGWDQEANSTTCTIYRPASGECCQGFRNNRSANSQPSNKSNHMDKEFNSQSQISARTKYTNDGYSCSAKSQYYSPQGSSAEDSKIQISYDAKDKFVASGRSSLTRKLPSSPQERYQADSRSQISYVAEDKYVSSDRSYSTRELPSSGCNSRDSNVARDKESQESSEKYSKESLTQDSANMSSFENVQLNRNRTRYSRESENPRFYGRSNNSKHPNQPYDRVSSGGETLGMEESQFDGRKSISPRNHSPSQSQSVFTLSNEIRSSGGLSFKNKISQEYYFPLDEKYQPSKRSSYQQSGDLLNVTEDEERSDDCDEVINNKEYQSISSKRSKKTRSEDSSYVSLRQRSDSNSEGQISKSFTNRSVGINSEEFNRNPPQARNFQYADEKQRKSQNSFQSESIRSNCESQTAASLQKVSSNGSKKGVDMASQCSKKSVTKARCSRGSIGTDTSYKSSEKFETRLVYSQFKEESSKEVIPKDQSIPDLSAQPVSGMNMQSNVNQYLADDGQQTLMINSHPILVTKKERSQSAPGCLILQSERPILHSPYFSPRNQRHREFRTLPQGPQNVFVIEDESCDSETEKMTHYPMQRGGKDTSSVHLNDIITLNHGINHSIMQAKEQLEEERCFNPRQRRERMSGYMPNYLNMRQERPRYVEYLNPDDQKTSQNPPVLLVPFRMESREIVNVCQPDEWRELKLHLSTVRLNHFQMAPEELYQVRGTSGRDGRSPPLPEEDPSSQYRQNTIRSPYKRNSYYQNLSERTFRKPSLGEEYFPPSQHTFSRPKTSKDYSYYQGYNSSNERTISTYLSKSENGYVSRQTKPYQGKLKSTLVSSNPQDFPTSTCNTVDESICRCSYTSNTLDESRCRCSSLDESMCKCSSIFDDHQAKKKPDINLENRNKPVRKFQNNSQTSSDSRCSTENQDSKPPSKRIPSKDTVVTSMEQAQPSSLEESCKPSCSLNKSIRSEKETDVEILETVTLLQPRRLRSRESARIGNQDRGTHNTVLLDIRTTCQKENLLQSCGRPPCNFSRQHYAGIPPIAVSGQSPKYKQSFIRAPQNVRAFEENDVIDPRDHKMTPPPSPGDQQQQRQSHILDPHPSGSRPYNHLPFQNSGQVREKVKELPKGFYDHTIAKYNIIRLDSNFQPPALGPEILQALQAQPKSSFGRTTDCSYGNVIQQQPMRSAQNSNRTFILSQSHFHPQLPYQPPLICSQQTVKLDDYDQSEYQI